MQLNILYKFHNNIATGFIQMCAKPQFAGQQSVLTIYTLYNSIK